MIFSSPDEAIRAYARGIDRSKTVARSVVAHGREYDPRCANKACRKARARRRARTKAAGEKPPEDWVDVYSSKDATIVMKCAYCLQPRRWKDAYILGGGGGGKKGRAPSGMIRAGDLAPLSQVIEDMADAPAVGLDRALVYVRYAVWGKSLDMTAHEATQDQVGGRGWSKDDVARCVRIGRAYMRRHLEARGLLREQTARIRGNRWAKIST